jgi:circadian clock protein KaiB
MTDFSSQLALPPAFKGIALFTPGGDFFYCIDPSKQSRWHVHLCGAIQERLGLPEPPYFLVPCYSATIDRQVDPQTGQVRVWAQAHLLAFRDRALLNAAFGLEDGIWQLASGESELCNPLVLSAYRESFPQLWENHEWVVRVNLAPSPDRFALGFDRTDADLSGRRNREVKGVEGYVLRLFIKGYSPAIEQMLQRLHELLETSLGQPYTLQAIDVLKHPELAEVDRVTSTPALIRVSPLPTRRIIGELDDMDRVLGLLRAD